MNDSEMLAQVKRSNLITGNYSDEMLTLKVKEVKYFMLAAGVPSSIIDTDLAVGVIAIGVNDLYSPQGTGGSQKFSDYFLQRVIQLRNPDPQGDINE